MGLLGGGVERDRIARQQQRALIEAGHQLRALGGAHIQQRLCPQGFDQLHLAGDGALPFGLHSHGLGPQADGAPRGLGGRKLLHRRAVVAAAASVVPVPGLDWAVDAALLSRLLPQISAQFGLTPEQLDQLDPGKREQVQKAVTLVGSVLIGKLITKELVLRITRTVGLRLTTKQLAKYVPLAGQAVAATVGYATLRYLGEQHLRDCVLVVQQSQLQLPVPR